MPLVLLLVLLSVGWAEAQSYQWSLVRFGEKGQFNTVATGTNDAGWIVGNYDGHADPSLPRGAFRFSQGKFYDFQVPGAEDAENVVVEEIGKSSTIVGTYFAPPPCELDCGDGTLHAFLYRHGPQDHIIIDVPGAFWTFPLALNDKRQVGLGYFAEPDPDVTTWGAAIYDYATKKFTPVTVFGSTQVEIKGMNNLGDLVGLVWVVNQAGEEEQLAFLKRGGVDVVLEDPTGHSFLLPQGINDQRVIVGGLTNGAGFRYDTATGAFQEIRHPVRVEGFLTYIAEIDNKGRMVAVNMRESDGYTESWWLRPVSSANMAALPE
ncbi:MAG TPA: hypothetical protein VHN13_00820 [Candidatus Tectomicrobia bacterium]|nr:hypothetical protein [Candidatus Tectomicrobia bacterium]